MTVYEIPLTPDQQSFSIDLAGSVYLIALTFRNAPEAGWILDISDVNGDAMVCGIPLVTGADLLAQYAYLGFGGKLYVVSDGDKGAVPTYANLGVTSHLYFETA